MSNITTEDVEALSLQWSLSLSDPAPPSHTLYDWLEIYGPKIMKAAVEACLKKHRYLYAVKQPMAYDHMIRYTSSCARNALAKQNEFQAPDAWLKQP